MRKLHWGRGLACWLRWLALACLMAGAASSAFAAKTYSDNGDGTVTDPTTGLQWMRCSMGQTWDGTTCTGTASSYTWDQANPLTGAVTFGGQNDWRVPTIRELTTIADRSRYTTAIDSTVFPNTPASNFWSASAIASYSGSAWYVDFGDGSAYPNLKQGYAGQVRLVRAGQSSGSFLNLVRPTTDYVDNGNGTVTHTPTGLVWQRCAMGQSWTGITCSGTASSYTWDQANALTDNFAGQTDWRLPGISDLESLIDYTLFNPALNATLFPVTPASSFWSASAYASYSGGDWGIDFRVGLAHEYDKGGAYQVRLVRAGQSSGSFGLTVSKSGNGTVSGSAMTGINCGSACTANYTSGTTLILTARPDSSSTFTGWSGDCTGTGECTVTMSAIRSVTASFTVTLSTTRLVNLSTRGQVQTASNVMIGGFIIGGSTPKKVLIRAVGPNLANYGITGVLADPMLELHRSSDGSIIASNNDWGSSSNAAEIQATGLAPVSPLESAILISLQPGAYTAVVSGTDGGSGVGIVEVYDIDHPETPLINASTRGQVQTGSNVMIGGFIIQGTSNQTVLIRAVGPNLLNYGVTGVLADPMLELHRSSDGAIIASNDNWQTASNAAAIQATGLAPVSPLESAILISLPPGAYTAVVSGSGGGTGVGIVEVYAQ